MCLPSSQFFSLLPSFVSSLSQLGVTLISAKASLHFPCFRFVGSCVQELVQIEISLMWACCLIGGFGSIWVFEQGIYIEVADSLQKTESEKVEAAKKKVGRRGESGGEPVREGSAKRNVRMMTT